MCCACDVQYEKNFTVSVFFWSLVFFCHVIVTENISLCGGGMVRDDLLLSCSVHHMEAFSSQYSAALPLPVRLCWLCGLGHARGSFCALVSLSGNGEITTLTRLLGSPWQSVSKPKMGEVWEEQKPRPWRKTCGSQLWCKADLVFPCYPCDLG